MPASKRTVADLGSIELPYPLPCRLCLQAGADAERVRVTCASLLLPTLTTTLAEAYAEVKRLKGYKRMFCYVPNAGCRNHHHYIRAAGVGDVASDTPSCIGRRYTQDLTRRLSAIIKEPFTNWTASYLLRSISREDQRRLHIDPDITTIEGMLMRVVLVPAITVRMPPPCDDGDTHARDQHQLSLRISEIVKQKVALLKAAEQAGYSLSDPDNRAPITEPVLSVLRQLYWMQSAPHQGQSQ